MGLSRVSSVQNANPLHVSANCFCSAVTFKQIFKQLVASSTVQEILVLVLFSLSSPAVFYTYCEE